MWYADNTVDPANKLGNILFPRDTFTIEHALPGFSLWFKCASGGSTTISPLEA